VRWGYTVHDVSFACPTITFLDPSGRYCGAITDAAICARCLAAQPEFAGIDIVEWRARHGAFINKAAFVIAPSQWAADTFARYFGRQPAVVPHGVAPLVRTGKNAASVAVLLPDDNQPTVAVLGAVGPDKGARQLERLVDISRARNSPVRFVLIGYLDREHGPWQSPDARFTVHGRYAPQDLPGLLRHYRVRLVLYPSAGPETFCYTLSETWSAGLPAMVPPVGALQERVAAQQAGFVMSAKEWGDDAALFDRLERLLLRVPVAGETSELAVATARSAAAVHPSLEGMVAATLAIYREGPAAAPLDPAAKPWPARRLRDALGYLPWRPPAPPADVLAARRTVRAKLAGAAKRLRRTAFGGGLHDLLPPRWTEALRSRLR
jgi:glycosyltransferase involved in cell wall biosynthesis